MTTADGGLRSRFGSLNVPTLPRGLSEALWLFVLMRVGLGLFALFVWAHQSIPGPCHFELALDGWTTVPPIANSGPEFPLVGVWQRWDACWYSKVATFGYELGQDSANFWPLLPALMRIVAWPFGGDVALSGLIVVGVAYVAAITGLYRLVARDFGPEVAQRTVLFITIAPAALFLFAPFTEAPFLAFTVWAILAARERRWGSPRLRPACWRALPGSRACSSMLPVAWEAWVAWREQRAPRPDAWMPAFGSIVAVGAPAVGFGCVPAGDGHPGRPDAAGHAGRLGRQELPPAVGGGRCQPALEHRSS